MHDSNKSRRKSINEARSVSTNGQLDTNSDMHVGVAGRAGHVPAPSGRRVLGKSWASLLSTPGFPTLIAIKAG